MIRWIPRSMYSKFCWYFRNFSKILQPSRVFEATRRLSEITISVRNLSAVLVTFQQALKPWNLSDFLWILPLFPEYLCSSQTILEVMETLQQFHSFPLSKLSRNFWDFLEIIATSHEVWNRFRYMWNIPRTPELLDSPGIFNNFHKICKVSSSLRKYSSALGAFPEWSEYLRNI